MKLPRQKEIPLEIWNDDSVRVAESRLLVDMIIYAHRRGETPEEILDAFPGKYSLSDIYAIVAFYLDHQKFFDDYLEQREKEAEKIRQEIESVPGYKEKTENLREKLLARKKLLDAETKN